MTLQDDFVTEKLANSCETNSKCDECVSAPCFAPRVQLALRQLLSALFEEYTDCVKKLLLPWKEQCETLDFNLQKWLNSQLTQGIKNSASENDTDTNGTQDTNVQDVSQNSKPLDSFNSALENCVNSFLLLKNRLVKVHDAVLKVINIQKEEVNKACVIVELQEKVEHLQTEIQNLEKNHKSAIELLVKDHESELGLVNQLLTQVQTSEPATSPSHDWETARRQLEHRHEKDLEQLRTYFEKKCADLEKHYSEEVYSQSCKVSDAGSGSSSDLENIGDMFTTPEGGELPLNNDGCLHEDCEKKLRELKQMLEDIQNSHKTELETVQSKYLVQLSESMCKLCKARNLVSEERAEELIRELEVSDSHTTASNDLELKMFEIKEELRREYENELEKIRAGIIEQEMKRKDEDINMIKSQLNEAHKIEIDKLWQRYRELANKEVENSVRNVKKEVILAQEIEEKDAIIKQQQFDLDDLLAKKKQWTEHKEIEIKRMKVAHQKEIENLKEALEIELTNRIKSTSENRNEEDSFRRQIDSLRNENERLQSEILSCQDGNKQELTENIRKEILCSLEQQIKVMVASGEEGGQRSEWPPELSALERQFTSKYQHQLAQLVEEHALELAELRGDYNTRLTQLVKAYSIKEAEDMPSPIMSGSESDVDINKLINERDNLRGLAQTLGRVVRELAQYISSCEDELNRSLVSQLINHKALADGESSESEDVSAPVAERKVHFAPDVTTIVSLTEDDCLLDVSADLSVFLRAELETCLQRLRKEAASVLGLTQKDRRRSSLMSSVEERRLTSLTRQLVEEKKAKEEANGKLQLLQELVQKYEQELNDVHKELEETKERMIKDKVVLETEMAQRQAEEKVYKLDHLQERARALIIEKGWLEGDGEGESQCPPPWLGLIELICSEGDEMIEDAARAKEELELQVEAADKQLRSTRAFLEEQAAEREQERDEFSKEIGRLREQLREKDKDWTTQRNFADEPVPGPTSSSSATSCTASLLSTIDTLELQVKETTELLKETEGKKEKVEKELKAAVDKIWMLRDIVSELEVQVSERCEREQCLERRLAELECELDTQARGQADLLAELRATRADETAETLRPPSPLPINAVRAQLKGMVKSMERQTRELEAVNIHTSCASLSSPSEDVSIREQFECARSNTPEPPAAATASPSTGDVVAQLNERLLRHWRATDNIVKQLRDRDMEIARIRAQLEEMRSERDVLQGQSERQLLQVAALRNRVEELRLRNERETTAGHAPLHHRIQELEGQASRAADQLADCQRKLAKTKQKLERSQAEVRHRELELAHLSDHQHDLVNKLREDLRTMQAEKKHLLGVVEKYRSEENVSLPQLVEVMLAEKNADIDHLQRRVDELQSQQEEMSAKSQIQSVSKSRGLRVSFADDVGRSELHENERARDVQHHNSSINGKAYFSTPLSCLENGGSRPAPRVIADDISKITEPTEPTEDLNSSPVRAIQLESVLSKLKSELEEKTEKLVKCEAQLASLEEQLKGARRQVSERDGELADREDELTRTRSDLTALQVIMEGLQQKLREAKVYETRTGLEEQLQCEVASRQLMQDMVDKLEKDKQNIISELAVTKSKSKSLQEELEAALSNGTDFRAKIESLTLDLEACEKEKKVLNANCQKLKKELDCLNKKQKSELKNILKKDSEEVLKMRNEIKNLKINNSELHSSCEKLQLELNEVGNSLDLLKELNIKDDKIQRLEGDVKRLEEDNRTLKELNVQSDRSSKLEIAELKVLIDDLNKNIKYLESKKSEDSSQYIQKYEFLIKKYETLNREYDKQRRARRECERKCVVLKDEIMKEKRYSAELESRISQKSDPKLVVTKETLVEITPGNNKLSNSLDNLADEVQKELNRSAQLDQSLITGLQQTERAAGAVTITVPCKACGSEARERYLRARLAELETSLNVERVVVSELRARLIEERQRYTGERTRAHQLTQEVAGLHVLNDRFQDRLQAVVQQLEKQSKLRQPEMSSGDRLDETKKLKQLLEEKDRKIGELQKEHAFQRSELSRLRNVWSRPAGQEHGRGDTVQQTPQVCVESAEVQTSFELNQPPLHAAVSQIDDLEKRLSIEESLRKALESKLKALESAERSRHNRRKATEEQLKNKIADAEKEKKDLEQECLTLKQRLRQRDLQLSAHTAESPLSLRLAEANIAVERLVGEKEDLHSANLILQEEKNVLQKKKAELQSVVDGLKSQIESLKIQVSDGGVDNALLRFADERAAWLEERGRLHAALTVAKTQATPAADINTTDALERYLRAENHRRALVWQKRFLQASLSALQQERRTIGSLRLGLVLEATPPPTAKQRFRAAVYTVRAFCRLQFLVERRRRTHANTCRLLNHALTSARRIPLSEQNIAELEPLWRRPNNVAQRHVGTGSLSQYLDRFHNLQDRIRDSLTS